MKEHKCFLCDTIYYSDEPGYYGYCSEACRKAKVDAAETDGKRHGDAPVAVGEVRT